MHHRGTRTRAALALAAALMLASGASAVLVQPYNYMLDDSALVGRQDAGSLAPYLNDQSEGGADKDVVGILGESLARLRMARMLDQQRDESEGQLSSEMAELIQEQQQQQGAKQEAGEPSLSASVAGMLLNVAQEAARASAQSEEAGQPAATDSAEPSAESSPRGAIVEIDTTSAAASAPSKADLKQPIQWYNPKETIPVLKISSMATPSRYKKVYFRSEKKLVDGAFHSAGEEKPQEEKRSLAKPFGGAGLQRRSSRGTSSSVAPPSVLQDGILDFLKKFRDVYVQTRPAGAAASPGASLTSSVMSAAASSPLASVLRPSGSSRPNFSSALSAASSMVNGAALVAQAASSAPSSSSAGSPAAATGAAAAKPLSAQSYVSFWSKTFPTWVRKMLKQMRRRSLHNSSKRHQHHAQQATLGQAAQAAASGAAASVAESVASGPSS